MPAALHPDAPSPQPRYTLTIDRAWDGAPVARSGAPYTVTLRPQADGLHIHIDAPYHDDPAPASPPGTCWALWAFEVVEVFIVGAGGRITELEVGPHGHHLTLLLRGPRDPSETGLPVAWEVSRDLEARRWSASACVPRAWLPEQVTRANAFAIHGQGDARRHLAWSPLPGAEPDFHQPDAFPHVEGWRWAHPA